MTALDSFHPEVSASIFFHEFTHDTNPVLFFFKF